jgi:hypothetical protein
MLINGDRLASVVRQHLVSSSLTLADLLGSLDAEYDDRVNTADPKDVLLG